MSPLRLLFFALVCLCVAPAGRAHGPADTSLVLSLDDENLEVLVSLSLPVASALLPAESAPPLSAATLDQHRPALLAAAARVCTLLDGENAVLAPDRVLVSIRDEHEVLFHFLFPPALRPATVRVPLLASLPPGTCCPVSDLRQTPPVHALLTRARADFAPAPLVR